MIESMRRVFTVSVRSSSRIAGSLFRLALLLVSAPAFAANHCVILQYHHFSDDTPAITSVRLEQFDAHLEYLQTRNFSVMPLRTVVHALQNNIALPDRCVSLTVDDAYLSVYQNAFPRLKKLGWPMSIFVNTEAVDQGRSSYMTWDQMREMTKFGVTLENHGHGHIHMIRRLGNESDSDWRQRVSNDINIAQRRITEETGAAPLLFAHPYGEYSPDTLEIVDRSGLVGFGQHSGPAWSGADYAALPRFPMAAAYAGMQSFTTKVNTLPLPVVNATPADPLVALQNRRPAVTITLEPGAYSKASIRCYISGSDDVTITWSADTADQFTVSPNFNLTPGRHRTNCTMPSTESGRYHWYSHNWFVRNDDGSWYPEY